MQKDSPEIKFLKATEEIKRLQDEREQLYHAISHDLRAPVRIIHGFTNILLSDHAAFLNDNGKKILKTIINGSDRLSSLINDLLNYLKVCDYAAMPRNTDMNAIVHEAVKTIGKEFTVTVSDLHKSYCDPTLMKEVWCQLVSNAVKFSKTNAVNKITISSKDEGNEVIYSISDEGMGFDNRYHEKLFIPFSRLHRQDAYPGNGIGLALVKKLIWAESETEKGAQFHFSLPVFEAIH
jgi:light-regulated signal transduction histidine kinase (bacteriophytochrome)